MRSKLEARNPKLGTLNSEPGTLNSEPETKIRNLMAYTKRIYSVTSLGLMAVAFGMSACRDAPTPPSRSGTSSRVLVTLNRDGPIVLSTPVAEFDILPSGYVQASLLKDGRKLTLEEPDSATAGDAVVIEGREVHDFILDFNQVKTSNVRGKVGNKGKRVEIKGLSRAVPEIEKTLAVEVYDSFPNIALTTVSYKNRGSTGLILDAVALQRHRLNASLADSGAQPYQLWSFQGGSSKWGQDDVVPLTKDFSQLNLMGAQLPNGHGGGIPVVAFWTASVGEAIGHVETLPLVLSLIVSVKSDGRIHVSLSEEPKEMLKAGGVFSTPRSFVAVYSGDFYEPLRLYSMVLQREGWSLPKSSDEAYNPSWCGWGYEFDVTPSQMLGTIPKLKQFNIRWATLDDRWFENYGDWNPRRDTFPGDSIKRMVAEFHRQGILVQLWWLPLGVEDGPGRYSSHVYKLSKVVQEHPDWLILDQDGNHARIARKLAALCPALPEVQEYYRKLTERFIGEWGFDGHKLDNVFTVPACYNALHRHKSPQDSINAMGTVYKVIFQTTRALKPVSVTQICPCGTPPNLAWLPFMDQAVTADPVGSVQVRRRIKMYKALLGPEAAVYGDHVELTEIRNEKGREIDLGRDFASTVGAGGVVGTKFVWPDPGPKFAHVLLTREKEALWKKWMDIYNSKQLSKGKFLNLYVTGYDVPEGYAIEKDGTMYYAFFSPEPSPRWKGWLELRGLRSGKHRVVDYENYRDLGTVDGSDGRLNAEFTHHLLLEVSRR